MTTPATSHIPQTEFIHFHDRASDHPFIEKVWRCHSDRTDKFLSIAANTFEMAITRLAGKTFLTLRGPETTAASVDCPAEGEWVCIRFKPGTFMPRFLPGTLRDHNDVTLPHATGRSFWLNGSALQYPDFENAETFVHHLARRGLLVRDPVVADMLRRNPRELSQRSQQRHFLRSTGVTYAAFRQIERAAIRNRSAQRRSLHSRCGRHGPILRSGPPNAILPPIHRRIPGQNRSSPKAVVVSVQDRLA